MQKEKTIDIFVKRNEGYILELRTTSQEEADRKLEELKEEGAQPALHNITDGWKIYENWFYVA